MILYHKRIILSIIIFYYLDINNYLLYTRVNKNKQGEIELKKYTKNIISLIIAIILNFFIWHRFTADGNSIIYIGLFVFIYKFFLEILDIKNKRMIIISLIISISFSIIEVIGMSINLDFTLNNILNKWLILNFCGYAIMAYGCILYSYTFLEKIKNKEEIKKEIKIKNIKLLADNKVSFFVVFVLLLIAWIPYFLRYYPGLLNLDSISQINQSLGITQLTNHHPIIHTGIISAFIHIGISVFNNINVGVALYSIFQMIVMALMFSAVLQYLSKKDVPLIFKIGLLLIYMFYPVNGLFSITMQKDTLFCAFTPIYIILTNELVYKTDDFLVDKKKIFAYILFSLLVMFTRNNGVYVVLLTMPVVLIALRKKWKKILLLLITIVISYALIKTAIFKIFDVKNGSIGEMLSIPLQQIARVKKYHKEELDAETIKKIDSYFYCDDIDQRYDPTISDPVKDVLNREYFGNNKIEFAKLWAELLIKYKKDYIESFLSNSYGYYYPEARRFVALRGIDENDLGIETTPIINSKIVSLVAHLTDGRDGPIYSMVFSLGMVFWITVILLGNEILKKQYKRIVVYWPMFILWLTNLASPVFCNFRYAFAMFTCLPVFIGLIISKYKEDYKKTNI